MESKIVFAAIAIAIVACAWVAPQFGEAFFRRCELSIGALARRPMLASAMMGAAVLLVRVALLPLIPIPEPAVGDELSYVFAGDTFAHGRLTNPPPPLADFFETAHVLVRPTYASKYFPGQGLFLAVGQVFLGHPWFGVWLSCGLLACAVCWAAFGWLPPAWALFAGALMLPGAILSEWMNSYWGGSVAALGGALVVGAAGRLFSGRFRSGVTIAGAFGLGCVFIYLTRPLEGSVLLVSLIAMLLWKVRKWPSAAAWKVFVSIGVSGAAWMGYYNFRVTGNPWDLPQVEYWRQYWRVPFLIFVPMGPPMHLRDAHLDQIQNIWERNLVLEARTLPGQVRRVKDEWAAATLFTGDHWIFLLPLLLFAPWVALNTRVRILIVVLCAGALEGLTEIAYFTHYAAPYCAAFIIVATQGFRYLRLWRIGERPVGRLLSRSIPAIGLAALLYREGGDWIRKSERGDPYAFAPAPGRRGSVEASLPAEGRHVILVRYEEPYQMHSHWVYNRADMDQSHVIWAHDLGPRENRRLQQYYPDRKFWLLRPNSDPNWLEPYKGE